LGRLFGDQKSDDPVRRQDRRSGLRRRQVRPGPLPEHLTTQSASEHEGGRSSERRRQKLLIRAALQVAALGAVAYAFYHERHVFSWFTREMTHLRGSWIGLALVADM